MSTTADPHALAGLRREARRMGVAAALPCVLLVLLVLWLLEHHALAWGWVLGVVVLAVVCAATLGGLLRRHLRALRALEGSVAKLADAQLGAPLPVDAATGARALQAALAEVGERIYQIVVSVRVGTTAIASTAGIVAGDNQALSQRTESQASALQQTASSMEQLTATVQQNTDSAQQAHTLASGAAEAAQQGGALVGDVVRTMGAIRESSRKIADITGVIDSIAFQTNILALNAAVEAARAGEQGRGFAVVAGEVRTLAQRAATAAREIRQLIEESVRRVEDGHGLAERTGDAMKGMVQRVQSVTQIMGEIVSASREQNAGLKEVGQAIAHIDEATQRNASLVQVATQTAGSLQGQARQLLDTVAGWNLGAREFGNADQARAMAEAGAQFVRGQGVERGKAEISNPQGRFVDRDLYLGMCDARGVIVANGGNPRVIGVDGMQVKDVEGHYFVREIMRIGETQGSGWVDYKWNHPLTGESMTKSAYVQAVGVEGMVISCGFYK